MIRILSIDGGGIKGVVAAQVLLKLEKMLQKKTGNTNSRIADHFDLIAGSGTGSITAAIHLVPDVMGTSRPKYTASDAVAFFVERGAEIYDIPLSHRIRTANGLLDEKYPSDGLNSALKDYFEDCLLGDLIRPCVFTGFDIKKRKAVLFKKQEAESSEGRNFFLKELLRATTATPTYFECALVTSKSGLHHALIDGSLFAGNPSQTALAEALHYFTPREKISGLGDVALLSIGTGANKKMHKYEDAKNWGQAEWSKPVIDAAAEGQSDMADFELFSIFSSLGPVDNYLRILPVIPDDIPGTTDNAGKEHIKALVELGTDSVQENEVRLEKFIEKLMNKPEGADKSA